MKWKLRVGLRLRFMRIPDRRPIQVSIIADGDTVVPDSVV